MRGEEDVRGDLLHTHPGFVIQNQEIIKCQQGHGVKPNTFIQLFLDSGNKVLIVRNMMLLDEPLRTVGREMDSHIHNIAVSFSSRQVEKLYRVVSLKAFLIH